ncbi:DUF2877 domain-containing protein [Nocardioides sp. MJB4]|uniref:DUF2877 domain-containing protein n=1 Tax=Nocardioides donggukensis TaxID=2774019 RepID=A0A927K2Q9_9ACTN|nr:DUF2877 domain-containing protein [Nocardioides donggukensis]
MLHLDDVPVPIGRTLDVTVPRLRHRSRVERDSRVDSAARSLPGAALAALAGLDTEARPAALVAALLGRGDGLTPLGDDVLCGWLALHRAAGQAPDLLLTEVRAEVAAQVGADGGRTGRLSAALLDCALHGEVLPEFGDWVAAVDPAARAVAQTRLLAIGHTSGAGLLLGADLALSHLSRRAGQSGTPDRNRHRHERSACA